MALVTVNWVMNIITDVLSGQMDGYLGLRVEVTVRWSSFIKMVFEAREMDGGA